MPICRLSCMVATLECTPFLGRLFPSLAMVKLLYRKHHILKLMESVFWNEQEALLWYLKTQRETIKGLILFSVSSDMFSDLLWTKVFYLLFLNPSFQRGANSDFAIFEERIFPPCVFAESLSEASRRLHSHPRCYRILSCNLLSLSLSVSPEVILYPKTKSFHKTQKMKVLFSQLQFYLYSVQNKAIIL